MSTYIELGSRFLKGAADTTQNNTGNWTVTFDKSVFTTEMPQYELYHIVLHGAAGSSFNVFIDNREYDTNVAGDQNSWNPPQPMILRPGQTVYFYWSDPTSDNTPPRVTVYLR